MNEDLSTCPAHLGQEDSGDCRYLIPCGTHHDLLVKDGMSQFACMHREQSQRPPATGGLGVMHMPGDAGEYTFVVHNDQCKEYLEYRLQRKILLQLYELIYKESAS